MFRSQQQQQYGTYEQSTYIASAFVVVIPVLVDSNDSSRLTVQRDGEQENTG